MTALRLLTASCDETAQRMSAYVDGELRGVGRLRVVRHLARCPGCRAALDTLLETIGGLRELGAHQLDPDAGLVDRVVSRLRTGDAR